MDKPKSKILIPIIGIVAAILFCIIAALVDQKLTLKMVFVDYWYFWLAFTALAGGWIYMVARKQ